MIEIVCLLPVAETCQVKVFSSTFLCPHTLVTIYEACRHEASPNISERRNIHHIDHQSITQELIAS